MGSWLAPIYTPGMREVMWSEISCVRKHYTMAGPPVSLQPTHADMKPKPSATLLQPLVSTTDYPETIQPVGSL